MIQTKFKRDVQRRMQQFRVDMMQFLNDFDANGPLVPGATIEEVRARTIKFRVRFYAPSNAALTNSVYIETVR